MTGANMVALAAAAAAATNARDTQLPRPCVLLRAWGLCMVRWGQNHRRRAFILYRYVEKRSPGL
jgi:hypothetical protein